MRLLIADDHALLRQGLLSLVRVEHPDWELGEADTLDSALQWLADQETELLLLDLNMPGMDGAISLQAIREGFPATKVAILTGADDRETILECLSAGAHGYVLKAEGAEQIMQALDAIMRGQVYVPPRLAQLVPDAPRMARGPSGSGKPELTARQLDVARLLAQGRATKEIARELDLGVGTVKVHLAALYRALGARSRMEAVVKAGKLGIGVNSRPPVRPGPPGKE